MAFSLFGRKDQRPTRKKTTTGAAEQPGDQAREPAPPPGSAGTRDISPARGGGERLLDFSDYTPPPPKARSARREAPLQPPEPAQEPAAVPQAPLPKPESAAPVPRGIASESGAPAASPAPPKPAEARAPVIEEAAILFANGQSLQALAALTKAVRDGNLGPSALQAWLMLFDLYRSLNMQAGFEALGMDFLVKFERSPPVWVETEPQFNPALATGGIGYCALTGMLSDASTSQLEQLRRMSQRQHAIRIDFARLQGVDPFGCARLLAVIELLRTSGKEVVFTGEVHLLHLLEAQCQAQNRDTDGVLWSLLFEILRRVGMKDRFEEAAVNYAVTYEVSPPSWETQGGARREPGPYVAEAEPAQPAFRLSGDVTGVSQSLPDELRSWAESNSPLVVDMSAVRRVDSVSAGQLLGAFAKLHEAGATIQVRGASELVAALFDVMGFQEFARIIRNR